MSSSRPRGGESLTIGVIAQRLGQPLHRVDYIINTRKIEPSSWAGNARVFTEADVERIAGELRRIAEARGGLS